MPTSNNHINNPNQDAAKKKIKLMKEIQEELKESLKIEFKETPEIISEVVKEKEIKK